jgi:hypothetical protein
MENTLHLALKLRSMLGTSNISDIEYEQIFVKTQTGQIYNFLVKNRNAAEETKSKIKQMEGTPVNIQRPFYAGQQLADTRRICEYNVQNGGN